MKTIKHLTQNIRDYRDGVPLTQEDYHSLDWVVDQLESIVQPKGLEENESSETKKSDIMTNINDIIDDVKIFELVTTLSKEDTDKLAEVITTMLEIKPTRVLINHELTESQKLELISQFHEWYYNTNQDTKDFAKEFYYVVDEILHGQIPVKLMYLDDYQDLLVEVCPYLENKILKATLLEVKQAD